MFHVSSTCVTGFVSFAFTVCWLTLTSHCSSFVVSGTVYQLEIYLFNVNSTAVILQYNFGSMTTDFEQVTVSIWLFFTWVLCIYIILYKGCNILYVFGLNTTVCSHIVDMHLSSDQITYDFMMDADLYNSFYQPSVCISLWYYIILQFGMSS